MAIVLGAHSSSSQYAKISIASWHLDCVVATIASATDYRCTFLLRSMMKSYSSFLVGMSVDLMKQKTRYHLSCSLAAGDEVTQVRGQSFEHLSACKSFLKDFITEEFSFAENNNQI